MDAGPAEQAEAVPDSDVWQDKEALFGATLQPTGVAGLRQVIPSKTTSGPATQQALARSQLMLQLLEQGPVSLVVARNALVVRHAHSLTC